MIMGEPKRTPKQVTDDLLHECVMRATHCLRGTTAKRYLLGDLEDVATMLLKLGSAIEAERIESEEADSG